MPLCLTTALQSRPFDFLQGHRNGRALSKLPSPEMLVCGRIGPQEEPGMTNGVPSPWGPPETLGGMPLKGGEALWGLERRARLPYVPHSAPLPRISGLRLLLFRGRGAAPMPPSGWGESDISKVHFRWGPRRGRIGRQSPTPTASESCAIQLGQF